MFFYFFFGLQKRGEVDIPYAAHDVSHTISIRTTSSPRTAGHSGLAWPLALYNWFLVDIDRSHWSWHWRGLGLLFLLSLCTESLGVRRGGSSPYHHVRRRFDRLTINHTHYLLDECKHSFRPTYQPGSSAVASTTILLLSLMCCYHSEM
jgi:hypothetical protein